MRADRIAAGLWRWTAAHPEWRPGAAPGSAGDWARDVGSVLWLGDDAAVLIDALVTDEAVWAWLDDRLGHAERVLALTTIGFHRRSRDEIVRRYGASTSRARTALPEGVEAHPLRGAGEVV